MYRSMRSLLPSLGESVSIEIYFAIVILMEHEFRLTTFVAPVRIVDKQLTRPEH